MAGDGTMDTLDNVVGLTRTTAPACLRSLLFNRCWTALRAWQKRILARELLRNLSDRGLRDIGLTRAEADYIAPNPVLEVRTFWPHPPPRPTGRRIG